VVADGIDAIRQVFSGIEVAGVTKLRSPVHYGVDESYRILL
jgi:hypothetical protein